jgi:hypothetical protein
MRCIRSEAVGIENFAMFKTESDQATATATLHKTTAPSVKVSAHQQYFIMVTDAAGSVSGILADRLSNVGTYNPAGTTAELQKLIEEIRKREEEKKKQQEEKPEPQTGDANALHAVPFAKRLEAWQEETVDIDLKLLQPKLQACVWRAKV